MRWLEAKRLGFPNWWDELKLDVAIHEEAGGLEVEVDDDG